MTNAQSDYLAIDSHRLVHGTRNRQTPPRCVANLIRRAPERAACVPPRTLREAEARWPAKRRKGCTGTDAVCWPVGRGVSTTRFLRCSLRQTQRSAETSDADSRISKALLELRRRMNSIERADEVGRVGSTV